MRSRVRSFLAASITTIAVAVSALPAAAAGNTITGATWLDTNRNGVVDAGESMLTSQQLYLFSSDATTYLGQATSDGTGHFTFTGITDGDYQVQYASPSWSSLRNDWVPSTTGTIWPKQLVHVAGGAIANFGWRPITRSADVASPIATYRAASGLTISSYDDAVSPADLYTTLTHGALVGNEAANVTIRFDWGTTSTTAISVGQNTSGAYVNYAANVAVSWGSWLDHGEQTLFHEYGHAWSLDYAYLAQQDANFTSYLDARGLTGNANLNTTYEWNVREIVAEDYRQLFGSAIGAAAPQMNQQIPRAAQVVGLRDFLSTTFMQPVATTPPPPPPPPPPPVSVGAVTVTPQPIAKSGTVGSTVSEQANVTVVITNGGGTVVRTLLSSAAKPAGSFSVGWDRRDAGGRRVPSGTYTARVTAAGADGTSAAASTTFSVS